MDLNKLLVVKTIQNAITGFRQRLRCKVKKEIKLIN